MVQSRDTLFVSTTVMPPTGIHLDAPASLPGTFDSSVPEVFDSWPVLPSSTRSTSPPLDFLVDEDPFANLATPTRSVTEPSYPDIPPHREIPRSPLADTHDEYLTIKRSTSLPRLAHGQPASERPAFPRKMSHISLRTLAQENTPVVMLKVRKRGTVGATLPLEPWTDQDKPDEVQMQIASKSGTGESSSSTRSDLNDAVSQATLQTTDGVPSTSILALDTPFAISVTTSPESSFSELPSLTGDNSSEGESSAEDFYDCEEAPPSSWTLPDTNFFTENWVHTLKSPVIVKSSRSSTDGVVDGGEGDERHHRSRQHAPDQSRGSEHSHGYTGNAKPFSRPLGQRNGSDGGDGGDDEDERRREKKDSSSCATAEPIPDSEEEETKENDGSSSDDDVPLAQRIPGALKAQKSIRQRVRADKEEKKKQKEKLKSDVEKYRQNTSNGTSGPHGTVFPSSKEGESSKSSERWKRVRAETMSAASGSRSRPILADDLLRKLKEVQVQASDPHTLSRGRSRREPPVLASSAQLPPMPTSPTHQSHAPRGLRPMRSLHHIRDKANGADDHQPLSPKNAAFPTSPQKSSFPLSRGRSQGPGGDAGLSRRATSTSRVRGKSRVRDTSPIPDLPPMRVSETINRNRSIKVDKERSPRPSMNSSHPSPPPVPADTRLSGPPVQKRIFIGDLQSYNTVEVRPDTTAADVVQMIENQGSLKSWDGVSTWMLHEVAQDFGMERPVRAFEYLSDVEESWNKDKLVNMFVLKMSPYAMLLDPETMPSVSPRRSGYIDWEIKRGKWTKRWLTLREHNLYLAKRDNGKDEILLCSLSNFDAYRVAKASKAPKSFTFAMKSTDKMSFFENTDDYVHVFSCNDREGSDWMEKILLARSYVLYQERNVLVNPKTSGGLSRAPTRKVVKPLLNVSAPLFLDASR